MVDKELKKQIDELQNITIESLREKEIRKETAKQILFFLESKLEQSNKDYAYLLKFNKNVNKIQIEISLLKYLIKEIEAKYGVKE